MDEDQIVIATELLVLSEEPKVAKLTLHTMEGAQEFAINGEVARHLIDVCQKFLSEGSCG